MEDDRSRQSRGEELVSVSGRLDGGVRIVQAMLRGVDLRGGGVPVLLSSLSGGLGQGVGFVGLVVGGLGFEHGEDDVAASSGDADDGGVVAFAF